MDKGKKIYLSKKKKILDLYLSVLVFIFMVFVIFNF